MPRPTRYSAGERGLPVSGALPLTVRCPGDDRELTLRRAWPRSVEHALLEFHDSGGTAVAGQWFADPARGASVAEATGLPAHTVAGSGVVVQPAGADRRLWALAELVRREDAILLSHRPERRAVVRLRRRQSSGRPSSYVKVVRPGRAAAVAATADRAATLAGAALRVARPLRCDEQRSTVEFAELPGRTALEIGEGATQAQLAEIWRSIGAAVRQLHAGDTTGLQAHSATDEAQLTRRWVSLATAYGLLGDTDTDIDTDTDGRLSALTDEVPGPSGLLHRDLHDKQLLISPEDGRAGIVDVDTLAVGEIALDIANLLVHLELRGRQGLLSADGVTAAGAALLAALRPDPGTLRRIPAYAAATRLRLAAVYAFRPRWTHVARALLDRDSSPPRPLRP